MHRFLWAAACLLYFTASAQNKPFSDAHWLGRRAYRRVLPVDARSSCFTGLAGKGIAHLNDSAEAPGVLPARLAALWGDSLVSVAGNPDAVFLLRDFFLSEIAGGMGPTGIFRLNLRVFGKGSDGNFYETLRVDSTYLIPGNGFTAATMRFAQDVLYRTAADAATAQRAGVKYDTVAYDLNGVLHIDSLEKVRLAAFNAPKLRPGIYRSFADFAANAPEEATVKVYPSKQGGFLAYNNSLPPDGNRQLAPTRVYAVVTADKIYKGTAYGFYEMTRICDDFFFAGLSARDLPVEVKIKGGCGSVEHLYGPDRAEQILSTAVAAQKAEYNLYRIDHLRGRIFPVVP